jgi:bifunctional DNA-binding transcriptional regulator/antitoxin component of YhaV-PrlF toxin-antitoxin module
MDITSVVTSKGQMTLPAPIRKAFKIGTQNRRVRFELCKDGSARIYPVADALSLKGAFADPSRPYDPDEREKAWVAETKRLVKGKRNA